jgi:hypothetical protein
MKNKSTQLDWLEREILKDKKELEKEKADLIKKIVKLKKEDILPVKPKKLSLWQRIKKVLMG